MKDINNIIGKGKDFEPPFRPDNRYESIRDSRGNVLIEIRQNIEDRLRHGFYKGRRIIAEHICELLNREHNKQNEL